MVEVLISVIWFLPFLCVPCKHYSHGCVLPCSECQYGDHIRTSHNMVHSARYEDLCGIRSDRQNCQVPRNFVLFHEKEHLAYQSPFVNVYSTLSYLLFFYHPFTSSPFSAAFCSASCFERPEPIAI